jgi:DNA-3-methyladenine glycosylase
VAGTHDPSTEPTPRLTRAFFERPVLDVAPDLVGAHVSHGGVTIRLTEVEAYDGLNDPGSHAFRGLTPRTSIMFGPPGGLYVYFSYGMHWCANLVCGSEGTPSAVLLRAGEVVGGLELARHRRGAVADRDLARGPARLTQALGLSREHNGLDVTASDSPVSVVRRAGGAGADGPAPVVRSGPRVGVSGAGGDGEVYPWRFWADAEPTVSAYRLAKPRRPRPRG